MKKITALFLTRALSLGPVSYTHLGIRLKIGENAPILKVTRKRRRSPWANLSS